jgi:hypothetical protein
MGDEDPVGLVKRTKLSDSDLDKILYSNARGLFKIA